MSGQRSTGSGEGQGWGADPAESPRHDSEHWGQADGPGGIAARATARMRPWPVAILAFVSWFLGVLPWLLTRSTTGTFGTPWNPRNHLREALLPFHHQWLPMLLTVAIVAGALSGLAPFWYRERLRHRWLMSSLATVGALSATMYAVWQSVEPQADTAAWVGSLGIEQRGYIALALGGSLLGLLLGLAISLGTPVLRTLAASVVVVVMGGWFGLGVVAAVGTSAFSWLPWAVVALTGVGTGILLAVLGTRPLTRLLAWAGACVLLVLTTAALTASNYVLEGLRGTNSRAEEVAALLDDGLEIFRRSAAITSTALGPTSATTAAAVALIVGAVGASLLARTPRVRGARASS